jgi:hypothetical protein
LLLRVVKEIKDYTRIILKSLVLFYKLDIKHASDSESCLINLITTLLLKNPVYSNIINLLKKVYDEDIKLLEVSYYSYLIIPISKSI